MTHRLGAPRTLAALGLLALLLTAAPTAVRAAPDLRPIRQARLVLAPAAVQASVDADAARRLAGLVEGGGGSWPAVGAGADAEIALSLPEGAERSPWLVVAEVERGADAPGRLVLSAASRPGRRFAEVVAASLSDAVADTLRLAVPKGSRVLRLMLEPSPGALLRLKRLRLYRLDPRGRANDYWLFVGASLTVGGIRDGVAFADQVAEAFPGYAPYVANEAVSGWTSTKLRRELAAILERHPHARYVAIHIGGNDVSVQRPYPGGADKLKRNLEAICQEISAAGKVPILARLSFRAYKEKKGRPAVPPEENGSGPYVTELYDPIIAKWCPAFFDRKRGCGVVDLYAYYKEHQDEIGSDGVHLRRTGYASWKLLWIETAGQVIYGRQ